MDEYATVAIVALGSRNKARKANVAEKRKADSAMRKPAGCGTKGEDAKEEVKKELIKEKQVEENPKSQMIRSMPKATEDGTNPGGVHYNGGVIYTSQKVQTSRCLRSRAIPTARLASHGARPELRSKHGRVQCCN